MLGTLDWTVLVITIASIVLYGLWATRRESKNLEGYLRGGNQAKWWTVGLSVMATQASAITFLSTPGQGYADGLKFVQIYFGLPLAMIVICTTFIPIYHKLKVYTAYEYLEGRFDLKTRILTSFLFLIQRGIAAGITIYAPAIIMSSILGWRLNITCFLIGLLVIIYTVSGGTKAVNATQKLQMIIIMGGLVFAFFSILQLLPEGMGLKEAISLAKQTGHTQSIEWSFNPDDRYNIWSGILGGFFLSLSYFGTDQSQVQRYLSSHSIKDAQLGLIFNALFKIPMQYFILFLGVLVFVFFQFQKSPIFFNQAVQAQVMTAASPEAKEDLMKLEEAFDQNYQEKRRYAGYVINGSGQEEYLGAAEIEGNLRAAYRAKVEEVLPDAETNDRDYVFIYFILEYIPKGLVGLLLAMIFSAAMSSTAAELNALATTSTIDIHKRLFDQDLSNTKAVNAGKLWTLFWGVLAIVFSVYGSLLENLIQLVNIVGSLFYGTILGIFLVAFYFKRIGGNSVFIAAILAEAFVLGLYFTTDIGFLWFNPIGCLSVIVVSFAMFKMFPDRVITND